MYLRLKRSLPRHLDPRVKKQSYLHVKWEVVRISVSCHKVIHKHYLCFNVIWSNLRCILCIPDNHTAPSAWIHLSGKSTCTSRLTRIKRLERISLTHAIWRTCKCVWAYAPRLDTDPIKEYGIRPWGILAAFQGRHQKRLFCVDSLFRGWWTPPDAEMISGDFIWLNVGADGSLAGCMMNLEHKRNYLLTRRVRFEPVQMELFALFLWLVWTKYRTHNSSVMWTLPHY